MRWFRPLFIAVFAWNVATGAVAQGYPALCEDDTIRAQCAGTCVVACDDPGFLSENAIFCINAGALSGTATVFDDPPNCPVLVGLERFEPEPVTSTPAPDAASASIRIEDCEQLQSPTDRARCVQLAEGPACSDTVEALIDRGAILSLTIAGQRAAYDQVLAADPLCAVTPAAFGAVRDATAGRPGLLASIRREAEEIRACEAAWQDFVARRSTLGETAEGDSAVARADDLARGAVGELARLGAEIDAILDAVDALETAGAAAVSAAALYADECDIGDGVTGVTSTSATTAPE